MNIDHSPANATAAIANAMASTGSTMMDKPLAPSMGDFLGLAVILMFWPWLVPSSSRFVLNHYRALQLYDQQEPNSSPALAASAPQSKQRWWKRSRKDGVKGWRLAVLIHRLHILFAFVLYELFILTLTSWETLISYRGGFCGRAPNLLVVVLMVSPRGVGGSAQRMLSST
jgi:hypothetical protein